MQYECVDEWTPGTCTEAAMKAYKATEADGVIRIQHVEVGGVSGKVIMRYMSEKPHDEVLKVLGEKRRAIENTKAVSE